MLLLFVDVWGWGCSWCVDGGKASWADGYVIGFAVNDCFLVGGESVWPDATVFADQHVVWMWFSGFLSFSVVELLRVVE